MTGLGLVTALGIGRDENWANAIAGRSGAAQISTFDTSDNATTIACQVHGFDPTDFMDRRSARRMDRFAQFAVAAARLALDDAGLADHATHCAPAPARSSGAASAAWTRSSSRP